MLGIDADIVKAEKDYDTLKDEIIENEDNDLILRIYEKDNTYKSNITSFKYVDAITIQMLTNSLNNIKTNILLSESDIDPEELALIYENMEIDRTYLSDELDENYELMETIGNFLIPVFIMPFFFLILLVTQMIGAEINEEKTSKSMEIIISSVSPKVHFLAKMITSNVYAILQSVLFILYIFFGKPFRILLPQNSFFLDAYCHRHL